MREAMSMQQLLDQIAEQLPVADEEPTDAIDLRRDSAAVASQMPSAAEAAEWATAGKGELEATPLSLASIRAQAKTMLAAKTTPAARQETLAALADAALRAARPHSAALIFDMAERRAWKVRTLDLAFAFALAPTLALALALAFALALALALASALALALALTLALSRRVRRARRAAQC